MFSRSAQIKQRGSGLAREGGGSVKDVLTDTPHSRASPLPQGSMVYPLKGVIRRHEERTWLTQNPLLAVKVISKRLLYSTNQPECV